MRVLSVNQDRGIRPGSPKGAAVHLEALRAAFRELGAEVVELDEADDQRLQARLELELAAGPVDLIYERYALGKALACRFAAAHGIHHALEVNAPLVLEAEQYRDRVATERERCAEAWLFRNAGHIFAVSAEVASYVREASGRTASVSVQPNGVDTRLFRPRDVDDPLRAELVPAGRFALGFHGRLRPWHGIGLLARATGELLARGAPVHLLLVGRGDFAHELGEHVPADRRTHVDWVPHAEVGRYVACFDALPITYAEGGPSWFSPLKLAEAMACGVVPLVPDVGDLPRAVEDGRVGVVYPAGDVRALADAIERLGTDPLERGRLAAAAVRSARERSWLAIAGEVLSRSGVGGVA